MSVPVERRWSAAELARVIRETEELVGLPLGDLIAEYQRGRKATATPARRQHRLIELLLQAKDAVSDPTNPLLEDAASVTAVELDAVLAFCREWQRDLVWPEFQRMLQVPGEYLHAISTLAVASALKARHHGTRLLASAQSGRTPDLLLEVPEQFGLRVEVKAPEALYRSPRRLDVATAIDLMRRALKKAGTGTGGQLATPGILVIAGWAMSDEACEILSHGTSAVLSALKDRKTHLFGVAQFNVRFNFGIEGGRVQVMQEQWSRLHRNPHYSGNVILDGDWAKGWRLLRTGERHL